MHNQNARVPGWLQALLDLVWILVAFSLSAWITGGVSGGNGVPYLVVVPLLYGILAALCQRKKHGTQGLRSILLQIAGGDLVAFALAGLAVELLGWAPLSRRQMLLFYLLGAAGMAGVRMQEACRMPQREEKILLLGSGPLAKRLSAVVSQPQDKAQYLGYLANSPVPAMEKYLGTDKDLEEALQKHSPTLLVVAQGDPEARDLDGVLATAARCRTPVAVIPAYNDSVSRPAEVRVVEGICLTPVSRLETCEIMGVKIAVTDMQRTLCLIGAKLEEWRGRYICVSNVHTTVTAYGDAAYRQIQNGAVMALPDGGPLSQFSREQGFATARRVTGPDLMKEVLRQSAETGWRHYFYGSTPETLDLLRRKLEKEYPGATVAGMMSPPFRALTPEEDAQIVAQINEATPDFVWVGLGAPKQERWMADHEGRVHALMVGVGAAFDYEAGNIQRAPDWMQRRNLEWLYRLMQDPKRLFKRYMGTNMRFLLWKWRQ